MLQATNDMGNATPAPIQCRDGDYAESEELCGNDAEEPANCVGGDCSDNDTENAGKCASSILLACACTGLIGKAPFIIAN